MNSEILSDFPKVYCPFIRQTFKVSADNFKQFRACFNLRVPEVYLAVDKIKTEHGKLIAVQNRKNVIDPLRVIGGKGHILEGIFRAIDKGYLPVDGEQAGELIGPKL